MHRKPVWVRNGAIPGTLGGCKARIGCVANREGREGDGLHARCELRSDTEDGVDELSISSQYVAMSGW
jgi:hypothetical protein